MENKTTLTSYEQWLRAKGIKSSTLKSYLWHLRGFYGWLGKNNFNDQELKKYFTFLTKKYNKVGTINLGLIILNDYLDFSHKKFRFHLLTNRLPAIKILNERQMQEFLDQPLKTPGLLGLRNKALLELLYSTGLKVGQIINLSMEQLDIVKKELSLNHKTIKIKPLAWFHLEHYLNTRTTDEDWLFTNLDRSAKKNDQRISVRSVERIIANYGAKLTPSLQITPQILRNTLAWHLKQQGAQTEQIKQSLHFQTKTGAKNYLQRI